jgi:exopolysaccharide production protein ExoQ
MQAYNLPTLVTEQSNDQVVWTADRVRGLAFWIPTIVVGLAYLTQHNLSYAAGDSIDYDQVSDLVSEAGGSSVLRELSFLAISALGVVLLLKSKPNWSEWNVKLLVGCLLMCTLMSASCIWAEDSFQSFKRSLVPLLMLIAALGIAKHWHDRELLVFVVMTTGGFLFLGLAAELSQGSFSFSNVHRFAGTQHPNTQGINCAILSLAALALFLELRQSRNGWASLLWLMLSAVGVGFLLLTRSRSATVAFGAALAVFLLQGASLNKKVLYCGLLLQFVAIVGVLWYASDSRDGFLSAVKMGREQDTADITTLTGRIPIWGAVLGAVAERPLLGYGYGGFWTPRRVEQFSSMFDWTFMHSHSAYLETLLNVGVIGLVLGLTVVIGTLVSASRSFRVSGNQGYHFVTALLVFALVHGFLDGSFARDGFETFVGALAISIVVFHGATSVARHGSRSSAAFARHGGSNAFGSLQQGALYHADLTTVSG